MAEAALDHLVIGAPTLAEGVGLVERALGVAPQGGGQHLGWGTRNALWRIGEAYLEVLAPDPDQPEPERPRMFGLDLPETRAGLGQGPQLIAWVARVATLDGAPALHGVPQAMARGDLRWRLTQAPDGRPAMDGLLPALIEWPAGAAQPPARMADLGLCLDRFAARDAPGLRPALEALGLLSAITLEPDLPGLAAVITSPTGRLALV